MTDLHLTHPIALAIMALIALLAFAISYSVSNIAFKWTFFPDNPDGQRKMQSAPVSRFGGIAIILGVFVSATSVIVLTQIFPFLPMSGATMPPLPPLAASAFIASVIIIGIVDDSISLPSIVKLALFAASAITAAAFGVHTSILTSPLGNISIPVILIAGSALWLFVFTNATNFMDGANGLSAGCLTIMLIGALIVQAHNSYLTLNIWWLVLFGAVGGFLIPNLRGRIYLGDSGALGLGALYACTSVMQDIDVWTIATFAWPFLVEVFMTLSWRASKGHLLLKSHSYHAYQCLRSQGWSHLETSFLYWGLSIACAAIAIIAAKAGGHAPFITFWILCPFGAIGWMAHRRTINYTG